MSKGGYAAAETFGELSRAACRGTGQAGQASRPYNDIDLPNDLPNAANINDFANDRTMIYPMCMILYPKGHYNRGDPQEAALSELLCNHVRLYTQIAINIVPRPHCVIDLQTIVLSLFC